MNRSQMGEQPADGVHAPEGNQHQIGPGLPRCFPRALGRYTGLASPAMQMKLARCTIHGRGRGRFMFMGTKVAFVVREVPPGAVIPQVHSAGDGSRLLPRTATASVAELRSKRRLKEGLSGPPEPAENPVIPTPAKRGRDLLAQASFSSGRGVSAIGLRPP